MAHAEVDVCTTAHTNVTAVIIVINVTSVVVTVCDTVELNSTAMAATLVMCQRCKLATLQQR